MQTEILQVLNVRKHFPKRKKWTSWLFGANGKENGIFEKAVDDVSFDLRRGEILGILGESGSGKTTLARLIMRLIEPTSGQIVFEGRDIADMPGPILKKQVRGKMRMIFQHPDAALNPAYTVQMILDQAMRQHSSFQEEERNERIGQLLNSVGLSTREFAAKYPRELSGGQKRRVAICRALATDPPMILADEPVSGLDVFLQRQIRDLLLHLHAERQLSMIFISHDIGIVRGMCDRIGIMYEGRLMELGTGNQVSTKRCLHPYTRSLYASQLEVDRELSQRDGTPGDLLDVEAMESLQRNSADGACPYWSSCRLWREKGKPIVCLSEKPRFRMQEQDHFIACHFV